MSNDKPPILNISDIGLHYPDGTHALSAVSLRLAKGEFVSVVGPSGCGKSTLLRLASGLTTPTQGVVERHAGQLGYVFQDPTLLPWRTVMRNVELLTELRGLNRRERRERATQALERVGLADVARHRPRTLSGGMRMRVSLARTLTLRPDLFLFDEPFNALDELTRGRLGDDLQRLFAADRFGALFVTHSVAEAVHLSTRVLVMSARPGRFTAEVPVPWPYPRPPELRYTAEFAAVTAQVFAALQGGDVRPHMDRGAADDAGSDTGDTTDSAMVATNTVATSTAETNTAETGTPNKTPSAKSATTSASPTSTPKPRPTTAPAHAKPVTKTATAPTTRTTRKKRAEADQ